MVNTKILRESFYDEQRTKPCSRGYVDGNGNRTGVWTEWHENGNFRAKGSYNDGYPEGEWTYGYENGSLEFKSWYEVGLSYDLH
jgi:antitoxin component YwqK of YwqJK toxin-antitoxin module